MRPKYSVETITPTQAQIWLNENNNGNRPIRKHRVDEYAAQMRRGLWRFTGEPIIFNADGDLMQGQHRLAACVASGTSFECAVLRGADPSIYPVLDTGMPRQPGDVVAHLGVKNANRVAATCRNVLEWRSDLLLDKHTARACISRDDIVEFTEKNREPLEEAVRRGSRIWKALGGPVSAWCAVVFETAEIDQEFSDEFFDAVEIGAGLQAGDPRLLLRNWCINRTAQKVKVDQVVHICTYAKAWNLWIAGDFTRQHLKPWRRGLPVVRPVAP